MIRRHNWTNVKNDKGIYELVPEADECRIYCGMSHGMFIVTAAMYKNGTKIGEYAAADDKQLFTALKNLAYDYKYYTI